MFGGHRWAYITFTLQFRADRPNLKIFYFPQRVLNKQHRFGGGGRTRTYELRIMSRQPGDENKENQQLNSAESGKPLQNPQPPRNKETS